MHRFDSVNLSDSTLWLAIYNLPFSSQSLDFTGRLANMCRLLIDRAIGGYNSSCYFLLLISFPFVVIFFQEPNASSVSCALATNPSLYRSPYVF